MRIHCSLHQFPIGNLQMDLSDHSFHHRVIPKFFYEMTRCQQVKSYVKYIQLFVMGSGSKDMRLAWTMLVVCSWSHPTSRSGDITHRLRGLWHVSVYIWPAMISFVTGTATGRLAIYDVLLSILFKHARQHLIKQRPLGGLR